MSAKDGSMYVPSVNQGPASAPALPRAVAADDTFASAHVNAESAARARSHMPSASISLTRLACFDVNGDGNIDSRSAGAGGDATLLVPTHEVDLPTWPHPVNPMDGPRPTKAHEIRADERTTATPRTSTPPAPDASAPPSAARTNRAVGAYQRYGQSAPNPAADTTPSAPVPAGPTAPGANADLSAAPAPAPTAVAAVILSGR